MPLSIEQHSEEGFHVSICLVPSASGALCILIGNPQLGLIVAHVHVELAALSVLLEEYNGEIED